MEETLALFFGSFKLVRKYTGGLWIKVVIPEIDFNEWIRLHKDTELYYDKFCANGGLTYEDYRKEPGVIK